MSLLLGSGDDRSSVAIRSASHALRFDDLRADGLGLRSQVARDRGAVLRTDDAAEVAAALTALEGWASEVHLLPPGVTGSTTTTGAATLRPGGGAPEITGLESRGEVSEATIATRWVLYTSGTTGEPKAISHSLQSLTRTAATGPGHHLVWGLLYDPNRMAGIQVILQGLLSGASVIAPSLHEPLAARVSAFLDADVNALSATPSLWRQILQLPAAAALPLRQITLGGEIADQRVLDALASAYPTARIVHVFASTETGAAFSVRDGREGFPVAYLHEPPRGVRLEIRESILHVHAPGASAAGDDGFASTGDIVEIAGDRVMFRGRASGVVNVGGANVWPEEVESILRQHPDVVEAVVTAKPNPMVGNVLVARVLLAPDANREGCAKRLRAWVRGQAPGTHVPASIHIDDDLELSAAGKVTR